MRVHAAIIAAALAYCVVGFSQVAVAGGPPPQGVPQPKILVIDRKAILERSAVGLSIAQQAQTFWKQAQDQLKAEAAALKAEGQALQQQLAILAPDVKAKKIRDFEAKQAAFQQKVQDKQGMIQGGVLAAQTQMENALGPILKGIMLERGANMLMDRNAVIFSTVDVDITQLAIQRLNQKMPTIKMTPTPLPPGVKQQQQAEQQ
jgi:outer membrane protein